MKKHKLVKSTVRKETLKIKKGGYHKEAKGDIKEMRRSKKKEIKSLLDEESMTTNIVGYLSNQKQAVMDSQKGKATPWYLDEKSHLKHSLRESLEKWLNEVKPKDINAAKDELRRDPWFRKSQGLEGWKKPLPGDLSQRNIPMPAFEDVLDMSDEVSDDDFMAYDPKELEKARERMKAREAGGRSQAKARSASGQSQMMTPDEAEKLYLRTQARKDTGRAQPKQRKKLNVGKGGVAVRGGKAGTKLGRLIDEFKRKANNSYENIIQTYGSEKSIPDNSRRVLELKSMLDKLEGNDFFFKTALASYSEDLKRAANEFARSKGEKEYNIRMGAGGDTIGHLLADNPPESLVWRFLKQFSDPRHFEQIMRSQQNLRKANVEAGPAGERGITMGSMNMRSDTDDVRLSAEEEEDYGLDRSVDQAAGEGMSDAIDSAFDLESADQYQRDVGEVHSRRRLQPLISQMKRELERAKDEFGMPLNLEDMTPKDYARYVPRQMRKEFVKEFTMDPEGRYRKAATRTLMDKHELTKDAVDFALEQILDTSTGQLRDPRTVKRQEIQRAVGKEFSSEEWNKLVSVFQSAYSMFNPAKIEERAALGGKIGSAVFDYVRDLITQEENRAEIPRERARLAQEKPGPVRPDVYEPEEDSWRKMEDPEVRSLYGRTYRGKIEPEDESSKLVDAEEEMKGLDLSDPEQAKRHTELMFRKTHGVSNNPEEVKQILRKLKAELSSLGEKFRELRASRGEYTSRKKDAILTKYKKTKAQIDKLENQVLPALGANQELEEALNRIKTKEGRIKIHNEVRKNHGIVTTDTIKEYFKNKIFNNDNSFNLSLAEMLLSAESSQKEVSAGEKTKKWEKAKPLKKKEFYPKLESVIRKLK